MNEQCKVWLTSYPLKRSGKRRYMLRWIDPVEGKWKSTTVGTDGSAAEVERRVLAERLEAGTHVNVRRITWAVFVDDHCGKIKGKSNATEARRTLDEFGGMFRPASPRHVTYSMIEAYVAKLHEKGNAVSTVNKKLRYLRAAINRAIRRGYAVQNPMDTGLFEAEENKPPRIVTDDEETTLLQTAEDLYGSAMRGFVHTALNTGGRRSELTTLAWDHIRLDGDAPHVHFTRTKSHRDRIVPINPDTVDVLRRLHMQTLQPGGPFIGLQDNLGRRWGRVRRKAGLEDVTIHSLRKTFITRLIRAGAALPDVQKLAGHADIKTTLKYYYWASDGELRNTMKLLQKRVVG